MAKTSVPSAAVALKIVLNRLSYDPETGVFIRLKAWRHLPVGSVAGTLDDKGYLVVSIKGRPIALQRVAWLVMTGDWPAPGLEVDHEDTDKVNNRWRNLRLMTRSGNAQNLRRAHRDSKHPLGVGKNGSGWLAQIMVGGKQTYLGTFRSPEAAHAAYVAAKRVHHAGCTL